jgi:hypothetical protein
MKEEKNHKCKELKAFLGDSQFTAYVIYCKQKLWYLSIVEKAREQTVRMGEADFVGEIMDEYEFNINFCPFCGKNLQDE